MMGHGEGEGEGREENPFASLMLMMDEYNFGATFDYQGFVGRIQ
jgi:hypothetical protein